MAYPRSEEDRQGRLDRFLFAPADPRAAALFRVALAAMIVFAFWPRGAGLAGPLRRYAGLSALYEQVFLTGFYWWLLLAALALYAAGRFTRTLGFALVLLLLPLDFLRHGRPSRQVLLFVLLSFSFLRGTRAGRASGDEQPAGPMWPVRLIQLQLSALYGFNALAKSTPEYLSGDALAAMSQTLPNFLVSMAGGRLHLGPLDLPLWPAAVLSTLVEYFLAVGFWLPRFRIAAAVAGVSFHLLLTQIVRIFLLDWVAMFLYLAFLLPFDRPAKAPGGDAKSMEAPPG